MTSTVTPTGVAKRPGGRVLGAFVDALTWDSALDQIYAWAQARQSRYVCICNVHSVVTATQDAAFMQVINQADMATTDGTPLAWWLRFTGYPAQKRINGPDLTWKYLALAEAHGQSVYFYGSSEETLAKLHQAIQAEFPKLHVAGMVSPPFRALSAEEDQQAVDHINNSGAGVVFVGLGCPKQEKWMAEHRGRIHAVMIGVGAAFDYHAGTIKRAPLWMQRSGLEWFHRLCSEPRRLGPRYFITNSLFIAKTAMAIIQRKV